MKTIITSNVQQSSEVQGFGVQDFYGRELGVRIGLHIVEHALAPPEWRGPFYSELPGTYLTLFATATVGGVDYGPTPGSRYFKSEEARSAALHEHIAHAREIAEFQASLSPVKSNEPIHSTPGGATSIGRPWALVQPIRRGVLGRIRMAFMIQPDSGYDWDGVPREALDVRCFLAGLDMKSWTKRTQMVCVDAVLKTWVAQPSPAEVAAARRLTLALHP